MKVINSSFFKKPQLKPSNPELFTRKNLEQKSLNSDIFIKTDKNITNSVSAQRQPSFKGLGNLELINSQREKIEMLEDKIKKMTKILESANLDKENQEILKDMYISEYQKKLELNSRLNYNPLSPYLDKSANKTPVWAKVYKVSDIKPFKTSNTKFDSINPSDLKKEYRITGNINLTIPSGDEKPIEYNKEAFIGSKEIKNLGKKIDTDMTMAYGSRINWSNKKIARDIMQNFYDGQGNTLDGINISVKKLSDGSNKVKISGKGFFEYENIQYLGAGNKSSNPYNAGGFGEGAKILVANLLGQKYTNAVAYSCADWRMTFSAPNKGDIIQRTLEKMQNPLEGNSIEFTTENNNLVDAVFDSINFFKHSKNPDFQNLTYDSKDFAFKIKNRNEQGNIYFVQRFEFPANDCWNEGVDHLDIIFKSKPDSAIYQGITHSNLPQDRDRTHLTYTDIENLTKYFATFMPVDDLISSIMSTKSMWGEMNLNSYSDSALKSFLKGLIYAAKANKIMIDFGEEKLAACNSNTKGIITDGLRSCGYTIVPEIFSEIGVKSALDAFHELSVHKALKPTDVEIKKLKLLEEGLKVVQEDVYNTLKKYMANADIAIKVDNVDDYYYELNTTILNLLKIDPETANIPEIKKYISYYALSDKEVKSLCKKLSDIINSYFRKYSDNPDSIEAKEFIDKFCASDFIYYNDIILDEVSKDYLQTIRNLKDKLITKQDVSKPRYIFDRNSEIAKNTLGEAIVEHGEYLGHWVDRQYLKNADFMQLLGTWIHEICHKAGGDGTEDFTYALTDMLRIILRTASSTTNSTKLSAIEEIFNKL